MKINYSLFLLSVFFLSCQGIEDKQESHQEEQLQSKKAAKEILDRAVRFTMINKHIIIPTLINDSVTANLLLDTGAGAGLYLDSTFARQKGFIPVAYYGDPTIPEGRGQYIRGKNYLEDKAIPIKVNEVLDTLEKTVVFDLRSITRHDKVDGMLGLKFMQKHVMEINFQDSLIVFHKPEGYEKPANVKTIPMIFDERTRFYYLNIEFQISDSLEVRDKALIDLGKGGSNISFSPYKVRTNNLMSHVSELTALKYIGRAMHRAMVEGYFGRINSANIQGLEIDTPRVQLKASTAGPPSPNLILVGNYVFSRYNRVIFDFGQRSIYIDDK